MQSHDFCLFCRSPWYPLLLLRDAVDRDLDDISIRVGDIQYFLGSRGPLPNGYFLAFFAFPAS